MIAAVVTFHKEGIFAHSAIRSFSWSRRLAAEEGLRVRFVFVLDGVDDETRRIIKTHPDLDGSETFIEVEFGDAAMSRNAGIAACSEEFLCTLDGDDLISREYFSRHHASAVALGDNVILHPEIVVSFGVYNTFNWQVDQSGPYFDRDSMLAVNPWISAAFARRDVFIATPYAACFPSKTGFGYEDWYWNCETLAKGNEHRLAWGTSYFYRRKTSGSVNQTSQALNVVMPKTSLFGHGGLRPESPHGA